MTAYCAPGDLLLGNIPLPNAIDPQAVVQDAADEIDSMIGFIYVTPVDITSSDLPRPVLLLLKRLNRALASGRLILMLDAAGEDTQLQAYGKSLVDEAMATLKAIQEGKVVLLGAEEINPSTATEHRGPLIANADESSAVDDFYGYYGPMSPNYNTGRRVNGPGGAGREVEQVPLSVIERPYL